MRKPKALLLAGAAALAGSLYLLGSHAATFVPYVPGPYTELTVHVYAETPNVLEDFREPEREALGLRDAADAALARGDDAAAEALLQAALGTFGAVEGVYDRLDALYMARHDYARALQAREALTTRGARAEFRPRDLPPAVAGLAAVEIAEAAGLGPCRHRVSRRYFDMVGPGVAVYDLDGDERPEVICSTGEGEPLLVLKGAGLAFTLAAKLDAPAAFVPQGIYAYDLNHDARPDLVVTGIGASRVYLNRGGLRFEGKPLPGGESWGSAAAAADFTGDGHVDLVIGGWLNAKPEDGAAPAPVTTEAAAPPPGAPADGPQYAPVQASAGAGLQASHERLVLESARHGWPLRFLRGDGKGGFADVTRALGVDLVSITLNLELIDVNGDGRLDLLMINDTRPHRVLLGRGDGTLEDVTYQARFADVRAGMGLAVADFNGDGAWDFVKTHFQGEMSGAFWSNGVYGGVPQYRDAALENGIGVPSIPRLGWAAFAWDFDADGDEDLVNVNGHINGTPQPLSWYHREQDRFTEISAALPPALRAALSLRGAALADLDGDGHDELVAAQNGGEAKLFKINVPHANRWLRVRVRVDDADALGGVLALVDDAGRVHRRPVRTGSAYFSAQPRDYFFGLGEARPAALRWRGRLRELRCEGLAANTVVTLTGAGCAAAAPATR